MGILCLTMITILFAIIRITVIPKKTTAADVIWICLWAHVETGVGMLYHYIPLVPNASLRLIGFSLFLAVIVACLASFRQLFVKSANSVPHKQSSYPVSSTRSNLSRIKSLFSRVFKTSSKASSEVANLRSPSRNHPRIAEFLSSDKLVNGPAPFEMTHIEEDFGASNKLHFVGVEKLAQKVHVAV